MKLLDTYLLSQWESDEDVDGLEEGVLSAEDLNNQILEEARDEWLVDDLVALGVCAENQMANDTLDRRTSSTLTSSASSISDPIHGS